MESGDDPSFVRKLFTWVERHPRCKMLVYYQDFGSTSTYRIQNYPASLGVLKARLHSPRFPSFAPGAPQRPPPPPGGPPGRARRGRSPASPSPCASSPAPPGALRRAAGSSRLGHGSSAVMLE